LVFAREIFLINPRKLRTARSDFAKPLELALENLVSPPRIGERFLTVATTKSPVPAAAMSHERLVDMIPPLFVGFLVCVATLGRERRLLITEDRRQSLSHGAVICWRV
jgi:hypothetical protein